METRKQWLSFGAVQLVLCGLWGVCLYRAFGFYAEMRAAPDTSASTAEDFGFSQQILFSYVISFVVGTALVWFMCRLRLPSLIIPILVICLTALYIIRSRPEQGIVLIASPVPFLALLINLLVGAVGGAIIASRKAKLAD